MLRWQGHATSRMILVAALVLGVALASGVISSAEADYPTRSIELVAWASPGGGSDLMTRTFAKAAEGIIPQPIYVVNKPGGGGAVGMAYVQSKPADGYTLLGVTNNLVFTPLTNPEVQFNYEDFEPIIMWGFDPKIIAVLADGPYETIEDLVAEAQTGAGNVKFGTFGVGTDDHIVAYMLGKEAGVSFGFVPFSGGGEQLAALLGGDIDAMVTEVGEVKSQLDAGTVRVLAVATEQRLSGLPDVPTLLEKGWDVVVPKFRGLVVKKGTPHEIVDYLIYKSLRVIQTPTFRNYLTQNLMEPFFLVGQGFKEEIRRQVGKFGPILEELGF